MKNMQMKSQNIASCVTQAKEAHQTKQTDHPSPDTDYLTRGPTSQCPRQRRWRKAVGWSRPTQGFGRTPPASRPDAFWREISSDPLEVGYECFHVKGWREPTSTTIRGASHHSLKHTSLGEASLSLIVTCTL